MFHLCKAFLFLWGVRGIITTVTRLISLSETAALNSCYIPSKMKIVVFLVFMLDVSLSESLVSVRTEMHGLFRLTLQYHVAYNNHVKTCCKFSTYGCSELMDSTGAVLDRLRSRTNFYKYNGGFVFTISNAKLEDAGVYRCSILDYPQHFVDFKVEIQEVNRVVPPPPIKSTLTPSTGTSKHVLFKNLNNRSSVSVGLSVPMAAALGTILLIILLTVSTAAIVLIRRRVKATNNTGAATCDSPHHKVDASSKSGQPFCDSLSTGVEEELNSVIYTMVDFKPHKEEVLYANLRTHRPRAQDPDPAFPTQHPGSVEYSMLAMGHST
ncbi:uncharacterized protein LOC124480880 isoform X2 [Hypomesus transpacificus]|uniref:uncharacterized protein LOC124480880 isoform X2 n=1 Tax=Hypomesus transpacificus TaxID=137520 RepID=UPI001F07AD07|nr:uncharacterized protein LOC124480880 isoform X2 [Hypomesus transpacificus]